MQYLKLADLVESLEIWVNNISICISGTYTGDYSKPHRICPLGLVMETLGREKGQGVMTFFRLSGYLMERDT